MESDKIKSLEPIISKAENIVFFTGAGISTECGIPDFRGSQGLFATSNNNQYKPEEILSKAFFEAHTDEFYRFYSNNLVYPYALPGSAHYFISALEKTGKNITVITQNIDGLHQKAGSTNVVELHGTIEFNTCLKCGKKYSLAEVMSNEFDDDRGVPTCDCGTAIKPDVVLYDECLNSQKLYTAVEAIKNADALIVLGSSLSVSPANELLYNFSGNDLVIINKGPTEMDSAADLKLDCDVKILNELSIM